MTDREKLIALVNKARYYAAEICHEKPSCKDCPHWDDRPHCRNSFIADHLIANGVVVREKSEWISVKDRLPPNGRYIICKDFDGSRYVGVATYAEDLYQLDKYDFYDYRRKKKGGFVDFCSESGYYELTHVTHWMPLPELPKEEET